MFEIITVDELIKRLGKYNHKELHIHHTWRPNYEIYASRPDGVYWNQAMTNFHINAKGWSDIAQHVTLLPDGRFATGRNFGMNPASITGYNTGAFAVEMIGDFDTGNDVLEGKQRESIIGLAKFFDSRGKYVRFHRENAAKTCPGTSINKVEFMNEVKGVNVMLLKIGSRGPEVENLQIDLTKLGYDTKGTDGIFGENTKTALLAFQKDHSLTKDGIAGDFTLVVIAKSLVPKISLAADIANIARLSAEIKVLKDKLNQIKKMTEV